MRVRTLLLSSGSLHEELDIALATFAPFGEIELSLHLAALESRHQLLLCRAESAGHEARCEQVRGGFPATGAFTVGAAVEQLCGHTTYLGESGLRLSRATVSTISSSIASDSISSLSLIQSRSSSELMSNSRHVGTMRRQTGRARAACTTLSLKRAVRDSRCAVSVVDTHGLNRERRSLKRVIVGARVVQ